MENFKYFCCLQKTRKILISDKDTRRLFKINIKQKKKKKQIMHWGNS